MNLAKVIGPSFRKLINPALDNKIYEMWLSGGRGSLKSSFATTLIPFGMMEDYHTKGEKTHCVALRKVGSSVERSIFNQFKWSVNKLGVSNRWKFIKNPHQAIYLPSGQTVVFSGCDDPIKLKSIKFEEGYIKYRIFEEFNQFTDMKEIRSLNQSFVRGGNSLGLYLYNPSPSKSQWTNMEAMKDIRGRLYHHSTYLEAPREWLGDDFFMIAEQLKEDNYEAYKNEYLGEVTGEGGEIFKNVREISLSDEDLYNFEKIRQGLDFGFTVDPTAFIKLCYQKKKSSIWLFNEIFEYGISTSGLCNLLDFACSPYETIKADSQEQRTINTMNHEYYINAIPCKKGPDSVRHGIKWLQDLSNIYIDRKRCPNAFREFSTYQYEKNKQDKFIKQYPDLNNHTIDATRYALDDIILEKGWRLKGNSRKTC